MASISGIGVRANEEGSASSYPLVTIMIVTHNRRRDLERCLESVAKQTYANTEVVVVDNASEDDTVGMVNNRFPSIQLVCLAENVGCPSGRNVGFAHSRGKYIYCLDDDGWLESNAIVNSVYRAESDPSIAVVMSRICEIDRNQVVRWRPSDADHPLFVNEFNGGCSLIRRDALQQVGYFPDDFFRQAEESDLAIRLLDYGYFCFMEPASVMYHAPSPVGRNREAFLFFGLRNSSRTAMRVWPFPWCVLKLILNEYYALRYMFILRCPTLPIRIMRQLILDLCKLRGQRHPVTRTTFRLFRQLQSHPSVSKPRLSPDSGISCKQGYPT